MSTQSQPPNEEQSDEKSAVDFPYVFLNTEELVERPEDIDPKD